MGKRVTLNRINFVGLSNWNAREWWCGKRVKIWSGEHAAWWRRDGRGYTTNSDEAWVLEFPEAYDWTKHCGPEKRIAYEEEG